MGALVHPIPDLETTPAQAFLRWVECAGAGGAARAAARGSTYGPYRTLKMH